MLSTCTKCQEPIHLEDFGSHGGWFIHSHTGRFFCATANKLCARHANLNPTYGSCAPLHWPAPGPSRYRSARHSRKLAEIDSLRQVARKARMYGEHRSADRCEAEARAIESCL